MGNYRTRKILAIVVLISVYCGRVVAGEATSDGYKGRKVSAVIEEIRAQGVQIAYSTALIDDSLVVTIEPRSTDPLDVASEILAPYHLLIRREQGLNVVVRASQGGEPSGKLLLIIREDPGWRPLEEPAVEATPTLPEGIELSPGVLEFGNAAAGKYRLLVDAGGFQSTVTVVEVLPGETSVAEVLLAAERPQIETITVSSSRYDILRDLSGSSFYLDQRSIQNLPDIGDDPLRASHRLPGVASSGVSARPHFRGGEDIEAGVILNGYELFEPFHARDFSNFFSVIDSRSIDGVEVYSGGFPVRYGGNMSGIVTMETIDPGRDRRTELGISVFNTSLLTAGNLGNGRGRWLVSGRRGNLDLIVDSRYGAPAYYDLFAQLELDITSSSELSGNVLYAEDDISVILASDPDDNERAASDTQNLQTWLTLNTSWTDDLTSTSLFFYNSFSNNRSGLVDDPERVSAVVNDVRDVTRYGFRQDWNWTSSSRQLWQWGYEFGHEQANYRYRSQADYPAFPTRFPGSFLSVDSDLVASPGGGSFGAYVSDKWQLAERSFLEIGLRWDDEDYTDTNSGPQISPRISYFNATTSGTEFRLSWGRYQQPARINELQIEDGVTEFWPAQSADHIIAGVRHPLGNGLSLRFEMYQKNMTQLRTRFENLLDPLEILPEIEPDRIRLSPTSARARGLEVSLGRDGAGPWAWWTSYAYAEVSDVIDGAREARSWDQRHALQAGLNYRSQSWDFAFALNAHSGWPTTLLTLRENSGDPPYTLEAGARNADRFAPFVNIDARVSRRFVIGDSLLTTFVEVSNVFDRHNPCCVDYDIVVDDNAGLYLDRQEDSWLPMIPSIGFLLEF